MVDDIGVSAAECIRRLDRLAFSQRVGGDVDERFHVRVSGRSIGDDCPAVGVADEDDRAGDGAEELSQVLAVVPARAAGWRTRSRDSP